MTSRAGAHDNGQAVDCNCTVVGDGAPLFLIHGIGSSLQGWDAVVDVLGQRYTCIAYDLRGHGESPRPEPPYTLSELVEDLERLRARLGIARAHFAGHSLGGMIGPAYARRYPQHVDCLGLLSTAAGRSAQDSTKVCSVVQAMRDNGIEPVLRTLSERWFTDDFIARQPQRVEARLRQVLACDPAVFLSVFEIYAQTETGPWLHEIQAPSLVLTGELDGGCNPRLNRFIASTLPDAELVILDGLKHSLLIEAPSQVAEHLGRFLDARGTI